MPRFIAISMVSSNFALAFFLMKATASASFHTFARSCDARTSRRRLVKRDFASFFFSVFLVAMILTLHLDAHGARGAGDGLHRGLDAGGVHVFEFRFRDFHDLR